MKRITVLLCLLLSLTACVDSSQSSVVSRVDEVLENIDSFEEYRRNNVMPYFEYYLPSSMSEEELDSNSIVLKYNNSKVIMNLNINNIINEKYYVEDTMIDEGFFISDYLIYERSGSYLCKDTQKSYNYRLYKYEDNYLIHLQTSDMNYYGIVQLIELRDLTRLLVVIAKNTVVNKYDVIKNYSNFDVIDYTKKQIDLFDIAMPVSGELSSLLIDGAVIGNEDLSQDGKATSGDETNNGAPIE